MSLRSEYKTDSSKEESVGFICYLTPDSRVTIARAGGSNKRYNKNLEAITRQHRRALANESMTNGQSRALTQKLFADTIVLNWETRLGDDEDSPWEKGIEGEGELLSVTPENILQTFKDLPDAFDTIQLEASRMVNFRAGKLDDESGN